MNASHMMIRKTIIDTVLMLCIGFVIVLYRADTHSSENGPETCTLGTLAKTYEPVEFSHGMHSLVAEDCATCHHHSQAGQTPACNKCHGVSLGFKESNLPGLKDAYHRQCMGCHREMDMGPTGCMECHTKRTSQTPPVKTASEKVRGKKTSKHVTETYIMSSLEKLYEPVIFSHAMHAGISDNCATCHHHSQAGQTFSCRECHGAPFDPKNLNMPGLKGAYHLQCMGCHKEIGGPVGCTECHAKKVNQKTGVGKK